MDLDLDFSFQESLNHKTSKEPVVLFVDTRRKIKGDHRPHWKLIESKARICGAHFVNARWLPGMLTNRAQLRRRIEKLNSMAASLKSEVHTDKSTGLTKKQIAGIKRDYRRKSRIFYGIKEMKSRPHLVVFFNVHNNRTALAECNKLRIKTIATVDTHHDPTGIDYKIPINTTSYETTHFIIRLISDWLLRAKERTIPNHTVRDLTQSSRYEAGQQRSVPDITLEPFAKLEGLELRKALEEVLISCKAYRGQQANKQHPAMTRYIHKYGKGKSRSYTLSKIDIVKTSAMLSKIRDFIMKKLYQL